MHHSSMEPLVEQNVHSEHMETRYKESACRAERRVKVAGMGQMIAILVITRSRRTGNSSKRASARRSAIMGGLYHKVSPISLVRNAVEIAELV